MIRYSDKIRKEVMRLNKAGLSIRKTAAKMEVSKSYVHKVLKEEGAKK